jgi:hypothetical protein
MTKQKWLKGAAILVIAALVLAGCNRRTEAQEGGSGGGAAQTATQTAPAVPAVVESPVSAFSYELTSDGRGIRITGFTGNLEKVVIPAAIEGFPVLEIGERAFQGGLSDRPNNRDNITSVVVPNSVEVIGERAFNRMSSLTELTLPDGLKVIPRNLAMQSRNLSSVNLPSALEEIRHFAFQGCSRLTELIIPESLTAVRFQIDNEFGHAFDGCQQLPIRTRQRLQELGYTGSF